MIRCKDIAKIVGVSRQAVTAVLNNSRPNCVSKEKRDEILKVAAEHHYRPDHAALALKTGRSNLVGIVMPPWENPYIAELCMALHRALAKRNHTPFFTLDNNFNPVPGNLDQLLSLHVAGMITVASSLLPDDIDIPVVSYYYDDPRFDSICPNVEEDSRQVIAFLRKCGHRKIGFIGPLHDRRISFLEIEAERNGMEFRKCWQIESTGCDAKAIFDNLLEATRGHERPSASIVHHDALAMRLVRRIRECRFRVPEDFSIISHDNISLCSSTEPALTSLSFGLPDVIAENMVELLMKRMDNPGRPRKKLLMKPKLIIRESVANLLAICR